MEIRFFFFYFPSSPMSDSQQVILSVSGGEGWGGGRDNSNFTSFREGEVARLKKSRNFSSQSGNLEWLKEPKPQAGARVSVAEAFHKAKEKVMLFKVDRAMLTGKLEAYVL